MAVNTTSSAILALFAWRYCNSTTLLIQWTMWHWHVETCLIDLFDSKQANKRIITTVLSTKKHNIRLMNDEWMTYNINLVCLVISKEGDHTKKTRCLRLIQVEAQVCSGACEQVTDNHWWEIHHRWRPDAAAVDQCSEQATSQVSAKFLSSTSTVGIQRVADHTRCYP